MPKLKPLEEWLCDTCGKIASVNDCAVEWLSSSSKTVEKDREFRMVHKTNRCYRHTRQYDRADLDISHFLGQDGIQQFLAMLDIGRILDPDNIQRSNVDISGFVDTFRRTQIPYYEEARQYFAEAVDDGWFSDQNEVSVFLPRTCRSIIERYEAE